MRPGFLSLGREVLAVEVEALVVFPAVQNKGRRVQARAQPDIQPRRPRIFLKKPERRQWPGRLVAVNAGGDVDAWGVRGDA